MDPLEGEPAVTEWMRQLKEQGWVHFYARRLARELVVVRNRATTTPRAYHHLPTLTWSEVTHCWGLTPAAWQQLLDAKACFVGAEVVTAC